ncbi:MAG: hypothetical protein ACF788_11195 [Novipirellula sp. JB048]
MPPSPEERSRAAMTPGCASAPVASRPAGTQPPQPLRSSPLAHLVHGVGAARPVRWRAAILGVWIAVSSSGTMAPVWADSPSLGPSIGSFEMISSSCVEPIGIEPIGVEPPPAVSANQAVRLRAGGGARVSLPYYPSWVDDADVIGPIETYPPLLTRQGGVSSAPKAADTTALDDSAMDADEALSSFPEVHVAPLRFLPEALDSNRLQNELPSLDSARWDETRFRQLLQ